MRISDWISDVCSSDLAACQRGRERIEFRGCFADKLFVEVPRQMEAVAERSDTRDQFAIARPRGPLDEQPGGSVGIVAILRIWRRAAARSEEHTAELQSLMRNSYAVLCVKKTTTTATLHQINRHQQYTKIGYVTRKSLQQ